MVGRFWLVFVISLFFAITGLIVVITSYYSTGRPCRLINCGSDPICDVENCYRRNFAHTISGIVISALASPFLVLSFCKICKDVPLPRIRLEWQHPETNIIENQRISSVENNNEAVNFVPLVNLRTGQIVVEGRES